MMMKMNDDEIYLAVMGVTTFVTAILLLNSLMPYMVR
jgi:hypothetical protein